MLIKLLSPLSGLVFPIESIPDPVFAQKTLGNGISIDPINDELVAPCDGKIIQIHRCHHALTIQHASGIEILIHIGIDTVGLKAKGFSLQVKEGQTVKVGELLIRFDADFVARNAKSLLTQMVVLNGDLVLEQINFSGKLASAKDSAIELRLKKTNEISLASGGLSSASTKQISEKISITNVNGLHARPVAVMTAAAKTFTSQISMVCGGRAANAKSVVAIMGLDVRFGDIVQFEATGNDATGAINTLSKMLRDGLGETHPETSEKKTQTTNITSNKDANRIYGVAASSGKAVGRVFQVRHHDIAVSEFGTDIHLERKKLDTALEQARGQLMTLQQSMQKTADATKAAIFAAHEEILSDPDILVAVDKLIGSGKSAAWSWKTTISSFATTLAGLKNELLAARANDVRDVGTRVLKVLANEIHPKKNSVPDNVILIAEDLTPSDVAEIDVSKVKGFCTVAGGPTSHVAILARSFGIPAIAATNPACLNLSNGTEIILDAEFGYLKLNPTVAEIEKVKSEQEKIDQQRKEDIKNASAQAITVDGCQIEVAANIGTATEAQRAADLGADGVGLLRSEFLFLDRSEAPSEDEQYEIYKKAAKALGNERPLIIRTLDIGGDKPLPYLPIPKEDNPFLGERGIRIGLNRPEILRTQLRAILRASVAGKILVMFPMISSLHEVLEAKSYLSQEAKLLGLKPIPTGIMVEVPSAAILADKLAPHVDFFSVGTNDLTQYTLAMDRGNPKMASQIDGLDPSILRLIEITTLAAKAHGKWVGVCGGLASDELAVPLLIGLGVTELSVSVPAVPNIKSLVRKVKLSDCKNLVAKALQAESANAVRSIVRGFYEL